VFPVEYVANGYQLMALELAHPNRSPALGRAGRVPNINLKTDSEKDSE